MTSTFSSLVLLFLTFLHASAARADSPAWEAVRGLVRQVNAAMDSEDLGRGYRRDAVLATDPTEIQSYRDAMAATEDEVCESLANVQATDHALTSILGRLAIRRRLGEGTVAASAAELRRVASESPLDLCETVALFEDEGDAPRYVQAFLFRIGALRTGRSAMMVVTTEW